MRGGQGRLQALIDTAVDDVIVIDAFGVVQAYNPACERLFGYQAEEVIGIAPELLAPRDAVNTSL